VITEEVHEGPARATAYVCEAASCMSAQSHEITVRLGERAAVAGLSDVMVKRVGCLGLCAAGPLVESPRRASCSTTSGLTTSRAS